MRTRIDRSLSQSNQGSILTSTGRVFVYPKYPKGFVLVDLSDRLITLKQCGDLSVYRSRLYQTHRNAHW